MSRYMDEPGDALAMLMEDTVLPHVPAEALIDSNDFRCKAGLKLGCAMRLGRRQGRLTL